VRVLTTRVNLPLVEHLVLRKLITYSMEGRFMPTLALVTFAALTVFAAAGTASAQYYYGPGYGPGIEPRYRDDRNYQPNVQYYTQRPQTYGYDAPRRYRTWNGCPPGFTVQDGVCKPYRGY
jgi:hypothetical protein